LKKSPAKRNSKDFLGKRMWGVRGGWGEKKISSSRRVKTQHAPKKPTLEEVAKRRGGKKIGKRQEFSEKPRKGKIGVTKKWHYLPLGKTRK